MVLQNGSLYLFFIVTLCFIVHEYAVLNDQTCSEQRCVRVEKMLYDAGFWGLLHVFMLDIKSHDVHV